MIKDGIFRAICLPLFAFIVPWSAGLLCCPLADVVTSVSTVAFFAFLLLLVWQLTAFIVFKIRTAPSLSQHFTKRIFTLGGLAAANGFACVTAGAWLWQQFVLHRYNAGSVVACGVLSFFIAIVIALLYETLLLAKERELDVKIVAQLDHERMQAELTALKAELDPHFIFNALTTVSHLAGTAPHTAQVFTQKLAQVYKYFLINKERELISLHEELKFIEDYFYLLQIRYDNAVQLQLQTDGTLEGAMILPVSLQLLVENAIKHNHFSERQPLLIHIQTDRNGVSVSNELRSKPYAVESTRIGLLHLRQHYKLLCNKEITIDQSNGRFSVTIPLIKNELL